MAEIYGNTTATPMNPDMFSGGGNVQDIVIDTNYNPESENAQSGKAVAQAMECAVTPERIKDSIEDTTFVFDGGNAFDSFGDWQIIDSEMSDLSENAVENRVIKKYVDNAVSSAVNNANNGLETLRTETEGKIEEIEENHSSLSSTVQNNYDTLEHMIHTNESEISVAKDMATFAINNMYPMGSVFITSDATFNPNDWYSGEWELFDKEFKVSTSVETIGVTNYGNENRLSSATITSVRSGHSLRLRLTFTPAKELSGDKKLCDINFATHGLQADETTSEFFPQPFYNVLANSDSGEIIRINIYNTNSGSRYGVYLKGGAVTQGTSFSFELYIPILPNQMLNDFCDKFYWKRIS